MQERLAALLSAQCAAGRLSIDDPQAAAQEFLGMVHGRFHLPCVLGVADQPGEEELGRAVEHVVAAFMRAYGPTAGGAG